MMTNRSIYSFLFAFLFFTVCNGQTKLVETQIKDPNASQYNNIHCGIQDSKGNLWFGTTGEGVYRYDGKVFTQFTVKNGLSSNTVWSILEDKAGNIWLGTDSGLCCYNWKTVTKIPIRVNDNFSLFTSPNNQPAKSAVWSMLQDKSGKMWLGTAIGMYCYDGTTFTRFLDDMRIVNNSGLQLNMIDCVMQDKDGYIWFGSGMPPGMEGITRFDGKTLDNFKPHGETWVYNMVQDKNGNILFATRHNGLCIYDGTDFTNITKNTGIANFNVWCTTVDNAGNIWIGTENGSGEIGEDGGLWRYDGKTFTKFTTKDGLSSNGISCLLKDNAGNIWIGTRNVGLNRYDGKTFTKFSQ